MSEERAMSGLDRRDFLTAVGAGMLAAAACKPSPSIATAGTVRIRFYGAMIFAKAGDGTMDVLIPRTSETPPQQYVDTTQSRIHDPFMGIYKKFDKGSFKRSYSLLSRELKLTGADPTPGQRSSFKNLALMTDILPDNAGLRRWDGISSKVFASRINLSKGHFTAYSDPNVYFNFAKSLNASKAPQHVNLANYVEWDADMDGVVAVAAGTGDNIPTQLNVSDHPAVVIANLPQEIPPKQVYDHKEVIAVDLVDHDFKWLYQMFYPEHQEGDDSPWGAKLDGRLLPAPQVEQMLRAQGGDGNPRVMTVGSPTCFGGCYGCE